MPKSILLRPIDEANKDERTVFNCLSTLDDSWHVVWGYYTKENGEEADFLILGPQGGLMVLEVKGWEFLAVDAEGNWKGGDHENPFLQVDQIWTWVKQHINVDLKSKLDSIHVVRALAVPNITRNNLNKLPAIGPRFTHILTVPELENFTTAWDTAFKVVDKRYYPNADARGRFFLTDPGIRFRQNPEQVYESLLDIDLDRLTRASMDWVEYLEEDYTRYTIRGGPGTGKTWVILKLAIHFLRSNREDGSPRKVLMLCYNKPLKRHLELLTQRLFKSEKLTNEQKGQFEVLNWESLLAKQLRAAVTYQPPPKDKDKLAAYYKEWLPKAIQELLASNNLKPCYDALIVDEAQDHTNIPMGTNMPDGWWTFYKALLNNPDTDPIAAAYDCDQVQTFTDTHFEPANLREWMGDRCAHLRLKANMRCTREIFTYLKSLSGDGAIRFPLPRPEALSPRGPDVEVITAEETLGESVTAWISQCLKSKRYTPADLIIIGPSSSHVTLKIHAKIHDADVVPYPKRAHNQLAYVSAGACKGIESQVVVVAGFKPFNELTPGEQHSFCLAASRARVRLVIIHPPEPASNPSDPF